MSRLLRFATTALLIAAAAAVLPAQQAGPLDPGSPAARVLSLTGNVSVLRDSQPWALFQGSAVQPKQIIVTGPDGYALLQVLSDGSTFEVFPNSRVTFRASQGTWKELVDLWLGHIKVHIQKLSGRPNPNTVRTPTAVISVRGTTFDVRMEDEDTTFVLVEEGLVEVKHAVIMHSEPRLLKDGDYIRVFRNQPLADKGLDKGGLFQKALRTMADAFYTIVSDPTLRGSGRGPSTAPPTTGGPGIPGDTGATPPPGPGPGAPPGDPGSSPPSGPPPPTP